MPKKTKFILNDHSPEFVKKLRHAEHRAVAKIVKIMELAMKKRSPVRTKGTPAELKRFGSGTNQRSIASESKGLSGSIRTNSGYGWWLEILKRTYGIGERAYMKTGYDEHKKKLPGMIRKEFQGGI